MYWKFYPYKQKDNAQNKIFCSKNPDTHCRHWKLGFTLSPPRTNYYGTSSGLNRVEVAVFNVTSFYCFPNDINVKVSKRWNEYRQWLEDKETSSPEAPLTESQHCQEKNEEAPYRLSRLSNDKSISYVHPLSKPLPFNPNGRYGFTH